MDCKDHYNKHRPRHMSSKESIDVRTFNNYVKSRLIQDACSATSCRRFLDLCCGNGGDIGKLKFNGVTQYFGIDVANEAVERAARKLKENTELTGDVVCFDAFSVTAGEMLYHMKKFDVVSCQFALHYSFGSEREARTFIQNVALSLRPGGRFIGTIVDSDYITNSKQHLGNAFGDAHHSVRIKSDEFDLNDDFDVRYEFSFKGAVERMTEYLVKPDVLDRICADCGFIPVEWKKFEEFSKESEHPLWRTMNVKYNPTSRIYTSFHYVLEDVTA